MANDNNGGRVKRKLTDYAGLAALVAAVGAIAFGLVDRISVRDEADRMNRSLFEHAKSIGGNSDVTEIAVLKWRVTQLEKVLERDHHIEPPPPPPPPAPRSKRPIRAPASDEGVEFGVGASPIKAAAEISFDQIQQTVEAGGVYEAKKK